MAVWQACVVCGKRGAFVCERCAEDVELNTKIKVFKQSIEGSVPLKREGQAQAVFNRLEGEAAAKAAASSGTVSRITTLTPIAFTELVSCLREIGGAASLAGVRPIYGAMAHLVVWGMFKYNKSLKTILHKFKYRNYTFLGRTLSWYIYWYFMCDPFLLAKHTVFSGKNKVRILIPVPTNKKRLRHRGFWPLLEILKHVNWPNMGVLFVKDFAGMHPLVEKQRKLNSIKRALNMRFAFYPTYNFLKWLGENRNFLIKYGIKLILFDDVISTGATVYSLASTLLEACAFFKIPCSAVGIGFLYN